MGTATPTTATAAATTSAGTAALAAAVLYTEATASTLPAAATAVGDGWRGV